LVGPGGAPPARKDDERGLHSVKDPLAMRPIWHHVARRVKGHIFVAALAFLIERMLERSLQEAGVGLSALEAHKTVRHVAFNVDGKRHAGRHTRLAPRP
jgi:transposase